MASNFKTWYNLDTLETISKIKKRNKCVKVIIYTNNMGPRSWTLVIKRYLERKDKA